MQEEKQKCYPSNIKITENEAIVNLQSLLDHTTERLFQVIGEVSSDNLIFFTSSDLMKVLIILSLSKHLITVLILTHAY